MKQCILRDVGRERWWEKEILDLVGAQEVTEALEEGVGAEDRGGEAEGVSGK